MPLTKTPTSSLSAIELLIRRVWYQIAGRRRHRGDSPETLVTHKSPATRIPQEIVEAIIVDLTLDTSSLLACSLTCRSWYIAAVPHLHHTLIAQTYPWCTNRIFIWPKPLRNMHRLGLLPLVKKFQFNGGLLRRHGRGFSPKRFNCCTLRHFSALTHVQELGIDFLDIPSFMPRFQRYFGHFLPTVRSLALKEPEGSCRQIAYFIGLFKHLDDLKLFCTMPQIPLEGELADDQALVPPFSPPLRGRLTMTCLLRVGLLKAMIDLFGGIRFRWMNLYAVDGIQLLLGASAKTLETLWLYPTDLGVWYNSLRNFDLSQNKSLRTLHIATWSLDDALRLYPPDTATSLLTYALSTITSPVFSEVVVFYRDYDARSSYSPLPGRAPLTLPYRDKIEDERAEDALLHHRRFGAFRTMHKVRDFRLVLCADVWDSPSMGQYTEGMLNFAVAAEKAERGFDSIFPEPLVTHDLRKPHHTLLEGFWADLPFHWLPP